MKIFYHYCPTSAFHAIVESKTIRLSSLSLSNDNLEGKLVAKALDRLAEQDRLNQSERRHITSALRLIELAFDGLGFCLSADGDLLSQWRAYSNDGRGFAVGFSLEYLEWLIAAPSVGGKPALQLYGAEYDRAVHETAVRPVYDAIRQVQQQLRPIEASLFSLLSSRSPEEVDTSKATYQKLLSEIMGHVLSLLPQLFRLKDPAFREEHEVRLLSICQRSGDERCSYYPGTDRIVPYKSLELIELERKPIVSLVMGPKNLSSELAVAEFLRKSGFGDVSVRRSMAPYR